MEFFLDAGEIVRHGLGAQAQFLGGLPGAQSPRQPAQHVEFPGRQPFQGRGVDGVVRSLHPPGDGRLQEGIAGGGADDGLDQHLRRAALADVAQRSGLLRPRHIERFVVDAEHQHARLGVI